MPKVEWKTYITPQNKHKCGFDALDLLSKMLVYDKNERLTAQEALSHPYFDPIRRNFEFMKK